MIKYFENTEELFESLLVRSDFSKGALFFCKYYKNDSTNDNIGNKIIEDTKLNDNIGNTENITNHFF